VLASRAPYEKVATAAKEHGWFAPWYSTHGSDFNYDYQVSLAPSGTLPARCAEPDGECRT
jgi:predicted dithiol-disulfide oxidoreductase (DUF899 family)